MKLKRKILGFLALGSLLAFGQGCTTLGSTSKAPIMKIHTGGSKNEREQEYLLKQIKSGHRSKKGIVLGLRHFTDGGRPISGAREKDSLTILAGPYKGTYTIDKVLRLVSGRGKRRRRRVVIRIDGSFFDSRISTNWKSLHTGSQGVATSRRTFTDAVEDQSKFPPEVPIGSQLVLRADGQEQYFTIVGNTIDRKVGSLQRVAYIVDEPLPKGLRNLRYEIRTPALASASKLAYRIDWRGSGLTGYNFTIGINRRRYRQSEVEDLLKSNPKSRIELASVASKRNAVVALSSVGALALVVGGFLALVRRDDFLDPPILQVVPWSIVGVGAILVGISIPLGYSANGDFLRAAQAYNRDIRQKLELADNTTQTKDGSTVRLAGPPAPTGPVTLHSTHP